MPEVHADGLYGVVPERGLFQARGGPVFFGVVPEKGGFQARGSGFLWGCARKGAVSGTGTASYLAKMSIHNSGTGKEASVDLPQAGCISRADFQSRNC